MGEVAHRQKAVEIHLLLHYGGLLRHVALITEGRISNMKAALAMQFPAGPMLVFDRGYKDYDWLVVLKVRNVNVFKPTNPIVSSLEKL